MKLYWYSLAIVLGIASCTTQEKSTRNVLVTAVPESAGFSNERLGRLDSAFNQWTKDNWVNGAVALVARDGKIVYYKSHGYNDPATKEKLNQNAIFRIMASISTGHL